MIGMVKFDIGANNQFVSSYFAIKENPSINAGKSTIMLCRDDKLMSTDNETGGKMRQLQTMHKQYRSKQPQQKSFSSVKQIFLLFVRPTLAVAADLECAAEVFDEPNVNN